MFEDVLPVLNQAEESRNTPEEDLEMRGRSQPIKKVTDTCHLIFMFWDDSNIIVAFPYSFCYFREQGCMIVTSPRE